MEKTNYKDIKWKENGKLKLLIIVGTRPEIIRLAAVINKTRKYFDVILAHTGQNYDYNLNGVFFDDLKLEAPEVYLNAVGHDLGHAPYGHVGERALNEKLQEKGFGYFCHNANSVRNILYLERNGKGYNVSLQVLDAILCHNGEMLSKKYEPDRKKTKKQFLQEYHDCWHKENASLELKPMTLEGCVVRISDVISYIGKDIEDQEIASS